MSVVFLFSVPGRQDILHAAVDGHRACRLLDMRVVRGVNKVQGQRMVRRGTSQFLPAQSRILVSVELRVPGWIPLPYVIVQDGLYRFDELYSQAEAAVTLNAARHAVWTYRTPPLPRGAYHLDATTCLSKDLFGIFEQRGQFHTPSSFSILPATVPIPVWSQAGHQAVQPGQTQAMDKRKRSQPN